MTTVQIVTPHLVVRDANAALEFYKKALGATETVRMPAEDGKRLMHSEIQVNGARIFVMDDFPEHRGSHGVDAVFPPGPDQGHVGDHASRSRKLRRRGEACKGRRCHRHLGAIRFILGRALCPHHGPVRPFLELCARAAGEGVGGENSRGRPCLVRNCARGAGTHNHRPLLFRRQLAPAPKREAAAYGSLRSQGRRNHQYPRPRSTTFSSAPPASKRAICCATYFDISSGSVSAALCGVSTTFGWVQNGLSAGSGSVA